jgi:hypothetical protein
MMISFYAGERYVIMWKIIASGAVVARHAFGIMAFLDQGA